jgi:alkylation response protein AidB-like acyl-CoA dehydrogenase
MPPPAEIRNLHDAQRLPRAHALAIEHAWDTNLDRPTGAVTAVSRHDPFGAEGESMRFDLQAITEPGKRYVALAEGHVEELANRAAVHDEEGSFPLENIASLQASGLLAACVPQEFGGLGNTSIHDQMVALGRLGRGDGSTAIATNMHAIFVFFFARDWAAARAAGNTALADGLGQLLAAVGRKEAIYCFFFTEPGTDVMHPRAEVTRTDGGWLLNGRKSFVTLSEAATTSGASFKLVDDAGVAHLGMALFPIDRTGIAIQHNWDALGMRGSGSHDVVLTDVFVPADEVVLLGAHGEYSEFFLVSAALSNLGLVACFLGIAEAARDEAIRWVSSRRTSRGRVLAESPAIQHTMAEIEIDLAACRAMLARTAQTADAFLATYAPGAAPLAEMHEFNRDFQCTKWFVNRKAIEVVDRALQLSGGSGYLSRSVLSRLYRDVRAGPFMQPFSPNEAFQYIGKQTLGLDPRID